MSKRDSVRASISKASNSEKHIHMNKYKMLRNKINSRIRKESVDYNNSRIDAAKDENELWKVVNDVINPNKEPIQSLKILKDK